jgi:Uma2 family endonuclease
MSVPMKSSNVTVVEYLSAECDSTTRHEYVDGQIFAMTGSTAAHNIIAGNLFAALHSHLGEGPCTVFISDMKVGIDTANCYYYPDVMVTCKPLINAGVYNIAPVFIAEVISPSTEQIDRREKLLAYKQIPSLAEYAIVYQDKKRVELYRKDNDGHFVMSAYSEGEQLMLNSLPEQLAMEVSALYKRIGLS